MGMEGLENVKAIAFDVQGTCVDFHRPILRAGAAVNRKELTIDWAALSTECHDLYRASFDEVIVGKRPWLRVDGIYREALDTLLGGAAWPNTSVPVSVMG